MRTCAHECLHDERGHLTGDCRAPASPECALKRMTPEGILYEDLKIEVWPPRDRGGQHVGTTSRGVRVEHLPTGLVAICTEASSQRINKEIAMDMIMAALTHPKF